MRLFQRWDTIRAYVASWDITEGPENYTKKCSYEIQQSADKKQYRLVCNGYNPKLHKVYPDVVEIFREYKNKEK